jgi:geranylgeranyl diphosphate synthase type II
MTAVTKTLIDKAQIKHDVDTVLADFYAERLTMSAELDPQYARLWSALGRLNQAGGKRLRPYMALLSYHVFGGSEDILPLAAAWELLHLSMLIHDDVIDNDLVRYGVPNIAGEYETVYASMGVVPGQQAHLAASAAILAGDLLLSGAHELVIQSPATDSNKLTAIRFLTDAMYAVAGGELLDTESVMYDVFSVDPLKVARLKTASYSFVGPLGMGAALAGATSEQQVLVQRFANELGCAYQLVDDLLGVFGDPNVTGKSNLGDLREAKRTYLLQQTYKLVDDTDRQRLDQLVGKPNLTETEAKEVGSIMDRCGAKQAVSDMINQYDLQCRAIITELSVTVPRAEVLYGLLDAATDRQK